MRRHESKSNESILGPQTCVGKRRSFDLTAYFDCSQTINCYQTFLRLSNTFIHSNRTSSTIMFPRWPGNAQGQPVPSKFSTFDDCSQVSQMKSNAGTSHSSKAQFQTQLCDEKGISSPFNVASHTITIIDYDLLQQGVEETRLYRGYLRNERLPMSSSSSSSSSGSPPPVKTAATIPKVVPIHRVPTI